MFAWEIAFSKQLLVGAKIKEIYFGIYQYEYMTPVWKRIDWPFIMAKYESPCQVLGLFAGAILVSCGVIYILTLEANKRYGDISDRSFDAPEVSGTIDLIFVSDNMT